MPKSDQDLDKEWKPTGRPQSTMALNFSAALDDLFRMDGGLDSLSKNVFEKKQSVNTQSQELEALEARLREAEERIKKAGEVSLSRQNSQRRHPVKSALAETQQDKTSPLAQSSGAKSDAEEGPSDGPAQKKGSHDLPAPPSMSGTTPETPRSHTSREYVMVDAPHGA